MIEFESLSLAGHLAAGCVAAPAAVVEIVEIGPLEPGQSVHGCRYIYDDPDEDGGGEDGPATVWERLQESRAVKVLRQAIMPALPRMEFIGPPSGITGDMLTVDLAEKMRELATGLYVKIDWLNVVCFEEGEQVKRMAMFRLMEGMFGEADDVKGRYMYESGKRFECGAMMFFGGRKDWMVSFNGDSLDIVGPLGYCEFFMLLSTLVTRCSRIDLALDDVERSVEFKEIGEALAAGNFTGFRRFKQFFDGQRVKGGIVASGQGYMMGRRGKDGSGRCVRAYDKELESKGEQKGIRWEAEFSGGRSDLVFRELCDLAFKRELQPMMQHIGKLIVGAVDFVDRGDGETHLDRMKRLSWWQAFHDKIGAVKTKVVRVVPTLEKSVKAAVKQYGGVFVRALARSLENGQDFLSGLNAAIYSEFERMSGALRPDADKYFDLRQVFGSCSVAPLSIDALSIPDW